MESLLFMNIGGPEIFLILAVLVLPIFCVLDIIRSKFQTPNANILWIIVVLVAPILGSLIYLFWGRKHKEVY